MSFIISKSLFRHKVQLSVIVSALTVVWSKWKWSFEPSIRRVYVFMSLQVDVSRDDVINEIRRRTCQAWSEDFTRTPDAVISEAWWTWFCWQPCGLDPLPEELPPVHCHQPPTSIRSVLWWTLIQVSAVWTFHVSRTKLQFIQFCTFKTKMLTWNKQ